jgi:hypothetical protein
MNKLIDLEGDEFEEEGLRKMWSLLLEDPVDLTDEQIEQLIKWSEILRGLLYTLLFGQLPGHYEIIRLARKKKEIFSRLPTKRLKEKYQEALGWMEAKTRKGGILDVISDGRLSLDSLPANSDICVIREILRERGVT